MGSREVEAGQGQCDPWMETGQDLLLLKVMPWKGGPQEYCPFFLNFLQDILATWKGYREVITLIMLNRLRITIGTGR